MNAEAQAIAGVVGKFAPGVASAILGPIGGIVVSLLENLFGVKSDALGSVISTDPQSAEKLKQFEIQHSEVLENINAQGYSAEVADRANARDAEKSGKNDFFLHFLALIYSLSFFAYLGLDLVSKSLFDKDVFHDLLTVLMIILSYYFGSAYKRQ